MNRKLVGTTSQPLERCEKAKEKGGVVDAVGLCPLALIVAFRGQSRKYI